MLPDAVHSTHASGAAATDRLVQDHAAFNHLHTSLPVMLQVVDRHGVVADVNERWLHVLGYTRTAVLGRHYREFITPATRQVAEALYIPTLVAEGQIQEIECEFVKADGTTVPVTISATATRGADGAIEQVLLTLVDSSERRRTERMLQQIARNTATVTGDRFFQTLVSELVAAFSVRVAFVTECANQALTRVRTLAYCKDNDFLETIEYDLAGTPCQGVINGAIGYYPQQLETLYPSEAGMESYLGIPFYDSRGRVLGHLAVLDDKPLHCTIHDMALLEIFAARSGAELECQYKARALEQRTEEIDTLYAQLQDDNRRLEQLVTERTREIEQRQRVAETLRDVMTVVNSNQALAEVLRVSLEKATELLSAAWGAVYLLHPTQQTLTVEATYGLATPARTPAALLREQNLVQQAIARRQPVVVTDGAAATSATLSAGEGQTQLVIPLLRQNSTSQVMEGYGGIILGYPMPRDFSDEEIQLAVAFSVQAALVIENARLRQQVEEVAVQEERGRLARELHDSVTQSLYSLTLLAEGRRRLLNAGQLDGIDEALTELSQLGQQALKEMRLLVHELRPPLLEQEGLLGALHQRRNAVERRTGIDVRLTTDDLADLPAALEEGFYRIAQEALNNSLKHAAATAVTIALHTAGGQVTLEVTDNGVGFEPAAVTANPGIGLHSMRERAEKLGGRLTLVSAPGQGTVVRVEAPLRQAAPDLKPAVQPPSR
ncbi:MAG: PAS domain S-box protein [Caldilineaceae bacterium]|nr:PAS domain S-box protein [Caldilineaceae bacterium]